MLETNVQQLIGSVAGGRVFPGRIPENSTYPAVAYRFMGGEPDQAQTATLRNPRLRTDVWAASYDDMLMTAAAVRQLLDRHSGDFSSLLIGEQDMDDPETGFYHRVIDFRLWGN